MWRPYLDRKARERNPALWDAAAHKPQTGKKRANYRKAARADLVMREFTLQNPEARCANCLHFGRHPEDRAKRICELGSDFQGYQLADAEHVCVSHNGGDLMTKTLDDALATPGMIAAGYYESPVVPGRTIGRHARIASEAFGLVHIASAILLPSELRRIADHLDPQPMADGLEPRGCPTPGACSCLTATLHIDRISAEARRAALEEAAKVAENACLVPPDGGSPTAEERAVSERASDAIRALIEKKLS